MPRSSIAMILEILAGAMCLSLLILATFLWLRFVGGNTRTTSPSLSAFSSKLTGAFVANVQLQLKGESAPVEFAPREAWVEKIYENYESVPIRKCVDGTRLCVLIVRGTTAAFESLRDYESMELMLNGQQVTPMQCISYCGKTTFEFPMESFETFPKQGEITFRNTAKNIESNFHYSIP